MRMLERQVKRVALGKMAEVDEFRRKAMAIESRYGFPPQKRYGYLCGEDTRTLVIEREWESLAAMEEAFAKVEADAEYQKLGQTSQGLYELVRFELLVPMP